MPLCYIYSGDYFLIVDYCLSPEDAIERLKVRLGDQFDPDRQRLKFVCQYPNSIITAAMHGIANRFTVIGS